MQKARNMRTADQIIKALPPERQARIEARTKVLIAQAKRVTHDRKQTDEQEIRTHRQLHKH